jgi:hypothetical protein
MVMFIFNKLIIVILGDTKLEFASKVKNTMSILA